ncbi:MAG: hypothetical protein GY711_10515 [bacterium]|nr:hypothetical protein [bacterium]
MSLLGSLFIISGTLPVPLQAGDDCTTLRVDPRLLAQAAEVWAVAGGEDNPIWPGWNVGDTPLLFYFPGEQEILVNHPTPPEGFEPYAGPLSFPGWKISLRNGETLFRADGQNTSTDVGGIETLVVADTLSNLRQNLLMWGLSDRPAVEKEDALGYSMLAANPYDQMGMILHEAFHVQQFQWGSGKAGNESALLTYPALSVTNNTGFALEADALAEALTAANEEAVWMAALRWLAIRKHRRAELDGQAIGYEDGTEFNEGLAKYTEWRLAQVVEGREPSPSMAWVRGFHGYDDMAFQREALIESMRGYLTGERIVNNDPYGTAPVRFRLYWSGMAIGGMLDVIYPEWKERMMAPGTTLTSLVEEALVPSQEDLDAAFSEVIARPGYEAIVVQKTKLQEAGRRIALETVESILHGEGTLLTMDYSGWSGGGVGFAFTPFGITRVDEDRTIYGQVPVAANFGSTGEVRQTRAVPLLHDAKQSVIHFRLSGSITEEQLAQALGVARLTAEVLPDVSFELPGASAQVKNAVVRLASGEITIELR